MSETTIKPPYGYRLLDVGETITEPHKFLRGEQWIDCKVCGLVGDAKRTSGVDIAVPIDPGAGWEIVPEGEPLQAWDRENRQESTTDGKTWTLHSWSENVTAKQATKICLKDGHPRQHILAFRRRVQPKPVEAKQEAFYVLLGSADFVGEQSAIKQARQEAERVPGKKMVVVKAVKSIVCETVIKETDL